MAYYVLPAASPDQVAMGGGGVAQAIGQALGRSISGGNRKPVDKDMIQRALAGLGRPGELESIISSFGIKDESTPQNDPMAPAFDAGAAKSALPGIGMGMPENAFQNANMSVPGVSQRSPADLLRNFFGVTQQEAARKMAGFGADGDSAITYRQALQGGIEGKYDAEYIKRNFPDKDPAEIEGALDRSKPISQSTGFREGGGLEAFGSNRVAKVSDQTRSVIENLKIYGVKGLKDFLSDTDAMREAGVDPAAVIEYYGDSIKKHGLMNMVPSDLRKHL